MSQKCCMSFITLCLCRIFCPDVKMSQEKAPNSWNMLTPELPNSSLLGLYLKSELHINWMLWWSRKHWRHNNRARTDRSFAVTFSQRFILQRYQSVCLCHWIFPHLLPGQPASSVCPWVNIREDGWKREREREAARHSDFCVSRESADGGSRCWGGALLFSACFWRCVWSLTKILHASREVAKAQRFHKAANANCCSSWCSTLICQDRRTSECLLSLVIIHAWQLAFKAKTICEWGELAEACDRCILRNHTHTLTDYGDVSAVIIQLLRVVQKRSKNKPIPFI